jgi:hypothetical protein
MVQILCTHVHKWKTDTCETVSGMGGGRTKEMVEGVNSRMIHLIYYKNICKCYNAPPPSTIKKQNQRLANMRT